VNLTPASRLSSRTRIDSLIHFREEKPHGVALFFVNSELLGEIRRENIAARSASPRCRYVRATEPRSLDERLRVEQQKSDL